MSLATSNDVGNTHTFWIDENIGVSNTNNYQQKQATLTATGTNSKIWVVDNSITPTEAQTLAQKFDIIYPRATNILGYEYGGEPGGHKGADGDSKIQILVYDIGYGIGGYFAPWDTLTNEEIDAAPVTAWYKVHKSNEAEIFYLDSTCVKEIPEFAYSTLVHELQHMINWNEKTIKNGIVSNVWYNEMLSMMTEDLLSSHIGIAPEDDGHVIQRIPWFLLSYEETPLTEWENNDVNYSQKYAYGAYLLRNYGGADILKEIMANNYADEASITAALNKLFGSEYNFN
jgi:hypothetical protein